MTDYTKSMSTDKYHSKLREKGDYTDEILPEAYENSKREYKKIAEAKNPHKDSFYGDKDRRQEHYNEQLKKKEGLGDDSSPIIKNGTYTMEEQTSEEDLTYEEKVNKHLENDPEIQRILEQSNPQAKAMKSIKEAQKGEER